MDAAERIAFDGNEALAIASAKRAFLDTFLPTMIGKARVRTAVDVGCGVGHFTKYLYGLNMDVVGLDGRAENVAEASKRCPGVEFRQCNIEAGANLGAFDLVLCVGLLYHLENPLLALRNLMHLTAKFLVIETQIAPGQFQTAALYEEVPNRDQGLNFLALILSEPCLIKCLYRVGFACVYRPRTFPEHDDFRATFFRPQRRTVLIAAKEKLEVAGFELVEEPASGNRYLWHRPALRSLLEHQLLNSLLKKARIIS